MHVIGPAVHYILAFLLFGTVFAQMYLLKLTPSAENVGVLARVARVGGIAALLVLLSGIDGVFHSGKGVSYYLHSGAFHAAITTYLIILLVSTAPALRFLRWSRAVNTGGALPSADEWKSQRKWSHIQMALIALMAVFMAMMARGVLSGG